MIYIMIAAVAVIMIAVVMGSLSRKKIYKQIDRMESWKNEIMNRPLTEEISKVKGLTMMGETEEKFESWRNDWDDIVTSKLPDIEEALYDAEECADKYKFKKASKMLGHIEKRMQGIEEQIKAISSEIDELITSEELNREDIIEAKEQFAEAKKYFLSHSRSLGKTASIFQETFDAISESFSTFDEMTSHGNHLEARSILVEGINQLKVARAKMEAVPELLVTLLSDIPQSVKDVHDGFLDMETQGYVLDHIGIEQEVEQMEEAIAYLMDQLYKLETEDVQKGVEELTAGIDQLYDLLENEVVSKQYVLKEREEIFRALASLQLDMEEMKAEASKISQSYQLDHTDIEVYKKLEKVFAKLQSRYSLIDQSIEEKKESYSVIREMMEEMGVQVEDMKKSNTNYKEKLVSMRKDELQTIEKLKGLRKQLLEARRMVQKSNLPGLPEHYLTTIERAEAAIIDVSKRLDEKPLEMSKVLASLEGAVAVVDESYHETIHIIETSTLAEKVIQFGNRFRRSSEDISVRLIEAEVAFRNYQYEEALTIAGEAIEQVQPGALKEMEMEVKQNVLS
ncbi:septation ring formation regulator EzrA [Fictibacillus macauensis ZFHKF-1]|uniref:Septation ring formation regulator EzrA n=1 Tax=Fictibacillus macauensis ZFHKF-1 TaxID=1196324 RepID=I8AIE3_9BACL|nr:septation ring formation regulator EzrA [Fictibacillus macauensis]EIT85472.1 septation ring formation regulator EzrA [Fictibacillus macauensis ZFHKF-1]